MRRELQFEKTNEGSVNYTDFANISYVSVKVHLSISDCIKFQS